MGTSSGVRTSKPAAQGASGLSVQIIHTSVEQTQAALRHVAMLVQDLEAAIEILVPRAVPYPLPLHHPPFDPGIVIRGILSQAKTLDCLVKIRICLARDPFEAVQGMLRRDAVVYIEGPRWRPSRARKWARAFSRAGYRVVFHAS